MYVIVVQSSLNFERFPSEFVYSLSLPNEAVFCEGLKSCDRASGVTNDDTDNILNNCPEAFQ